jgi:hypothetical protein
MTVTFPATATDPVERDDATEAFVDLHYALTATA